MKNIKLLFLALMVSFTFQSCEEEVEALDTNYVTFESSSVSAGVDPGSTASVDVKVFTANVTGADRTFNVTVDGSGAAAGSYTVPSSVTIPAGTNEGTLTVALSDTNLGIGVNRVVIGFETQEGLSNGGSTTVSYIQNCTETTATIAFTFDAYPEETSWQITDSLGGVVASGDSYDGQASASIPVSLCAGRSYTFTVFDVYSDGICCDYGNGSYSVTIGGTVVASGGSFGASESTPFTT